jgi:lipoate-protein ligase A
VRRPTGGRALLHHREVTYSATLPVNGADEARSVYHFINGVLIDGLRRLGVPAIAASATQSLPPGLRPCFDVPAEHEIVVHGRKLVGSAQWRSGGALLQHGSILIRDDQQIIGELVVDRPLSAFPPAATLAETLGYEPRLEEVGTLMLESLQGQALTRVESLTLEPDLIRDVSQLRETYTDDLWTWRR